VKYRSFLFAGLGLFATFTVAAADLPDPANAKTVMLFKVPNYCEGVVFDHAGNGYISWGKTITKFSIDGKHAPWAETGAPNGHKILADGTHLVCDASRHAVLKLSPEGKLLEPASKECDGQPLRGPNDLTLDTPNGGFYFSDPGESSLEKRIGTVHYVDQAGKTHLVDKGLAFPNGIVLTPDGKKLYLAESQTNQVHVYEVKGPGKLGERKLFANLPKHPSGDHLRSQPDGMCLDAAGNLYVAHYGMKQVQVLDPSGKLIRQYNGGNETTSNVAFGGPNMTTLYITGGLGKEAGEGGLFTLELGVKGLVILPVKR
jgi:gluconolactonase